VIIATLRDDSTVRHNIISAISRPGFRLYVQKSEIENPTFDSAIYEHAAKADARVISREVVEIAGFARDDNILSEFFSVFESFRDSGISLIIAAHHGKKAHRTGFVDKTGDCGS